MTWLTVVILQHPYKEKDYARWWISTEKAPKDVIFSEFQNNLINIATNDALKDEYLTRGEYRGDGEVFLKVSFQQEEFDLSVPELGEKVKAGEIPYLT